MPTAQLLIVEDEPIIAADLADRLTESGYTVLGPCDAGEAALELARRRQPDLVLLDIQLAGPMDGIALGHALTDLYQNLPIVFLTSNSDDATYARARAVAPRAFLSKPFRGRDLAHAIDLALGTPAQPSNAEPTAAAQASSTQQNTTTSAPVEELPEGESAARFQDRLFIRDKERLVRLMLDDILYVEADDYYCKVVTANRAYLVTKTLKKLSALLPDEQFARCHRSYLINLPRVTEIGEIYLFLGQEKVPVSRSKRADILRALGNG